jgi:hypothetical protein
MLNKISWSSFIWILVLAVVVYYLYVFIAYYRKDIFSFGTITKKPPELKNKNKSSINNKPSHPDNSPIEPEIPGEESFTVVHELLEDLKELFLTASKKKMVKEELIQAIGSKLKTYPSLRETELAEDINTHLILESKEKCQMDLLPEDLKQIWNI